MRLGAKKRRGAYKTDVAYIRAVYQHNKKKIDKNISPEWVEAYGDSYKAFKNLILEQMKYQNPKTNKKYTVEEALKRESRSKDLNKTWTSTDISNRNFHELVKKDKDMYQLFKQHEGIKKINYSAYQFEGYFNFQGRPCAVYSYNDGEGSTDSYFFEFQSPKDATGATLFYYNGYQVQR